jgi:hypothetical protein
VQQKSDLPSHAYFLYPTLQIASTPRGEMMTKLIFHTPTARMVTVTVPTDQVDERVDYLESLGWRLVYQAPTR